VIGRVYPDGTVAIDVPPGDLPRLGPGAPAGVAGGVGAEPASALWASYAAVVDPWLCDGVTERARGLVAPHPARGPAGDQLVGEHADVVGPMMLSRASAMLHAANRTWWRLDVDEVRFKLLRYRNGHGIGQHRDMFPGSMCRKVSVSVQLSRPGSYDEGRLELSDGRGGWRAPSAAQGSAVVFPAWTPHRVTPVTAGERWSLVVWGYGPPVR